MSSSAQNKSALAEAETLFAQALQLFPSKHDDSHPVTDDSPILDPASGLAARFCHVCKDRLDALDESQLSPTDAVISWQLEQNTWDLIADLYLDRASPDFEGPSPRTLVQNNPYTPDNVLVHQALECSPLLNELLLMRNWLQRTAPAPNRPDPRRGYWRHTKLELVHQLRSTSTRTRGVTGVKPSVNNIVKEMDPDVVARSARVGVPTVLEPKDAELEKSLSQSLFNHIRAGELDQAMQVCSAMDQPWRSAALRGAKTFCWDQLVGNVEKESYAMDEGDATKFVSLHGNPRRKLWRKACKVSATNTALPSSARLLFASLAPSASTLPTLAVGLRTWEDHLWARVCALFEDRIDVLLDRFGSFWNSTSIRSVGLEVSKDVDVETNEEDDEDAFEEQIEGVLKELETVKVNSRFDFNDRFHWAQYHIILDRTDEMFELFAEHLRTLAGNASPQSNEHTQQLRFFAHFCLYLRQIRRDVPLDAANVILQAYISLLEEQGQGELVALYVGALGENAIQRYAIFLSKLNVDSPRHERLIALNRARDHGLDVEAVAFSTASLIAREELKKLPPYTQELPLVVDSDMEIQPTERVLLRSVEWLTFHPNNHEAALRQANALMRYLLGFGRVPAARELLLAIPPEVTSEAVNYPVEGPELIHFRHFFEVWDGFTALVVVRGSEPGFGQKAQALEWRKQYGHILDGVREACQNLFTSGWLQPLTESEYDERRKAETRRIREIFIPELVLRLHQELIVSRELFPANLKHLYIISTVVADERYQLYRDFFTTSTADGKPKNRLLEYLYAMREVGLGALESGNRDPFSVLAQ